MSKFRKNEYSRQCPSYWVYFHTVFPAMLWDYVWIMRSTPIIAPCNTWCIGSYKVLWRNMLPNKVRLGLMKSLLNLILNFRQVRLVSWKIYGLPVMQRLYSVVIEVSIYVNNFIDILLSLCMNVFIVQLLRYKHLCLWARYYNCFSSPRGINGYLRGG